MKRQTITFIVSASLLLLTLLPVHLAASGLTLAWSPSPEPDLAGYKIYYGTESREYDFVIDAGNVTCYTVWYLAPETRYYFTLTAYDTSLNESDFSDEVSGVTGDDPDPVVSTTDSEKGGCFIATAAYGSYLDHHVQTLRDFRDEFLIPSSLGSKLVHFYYKHAPRLANQIEKHCLVRFITRQALLPVIWMSSFFLEKTTSPPFLFLPLCSLLIFTLLIRFCPRRAR